jgi:DNA-binding SARP family transcriptional activator
MSLTTLTKPSLDVLKEQFASNRLLLLHPSSRYRTLLIAALIEDPPCPIYYYGLGAEDTNLPQFLVGFIHDLADQSPTFGRRTNEAQRQQPTDPAALARALADDLAELEDTDYLLILDEYDRADAVEDIQVFVELLLDDLPEHCHILINSRTLPRLPWLALVTKHTAAVLRNDQMLTSGFYAERDPHQPALEVHAFGPGYVMIDGQHISAWEGHLPRLLFFFVLDRPLVTRSEICQAFWPELPLDQAVNVFHVTKRRLHKAIGLDVLLHESGHYRVSSDLNIEYDVLQFVQALVDARTTSGEEAAGAWQRAIDLYRGEYLQGHDEAWIIARRDDFRSGYLEALTQLAHIRTAQEQYEQALGLHLRAVSEYPNREDIHREIMLLYGKLGRRSEAAEHYQKLEQRLRETFGISPAPETQAVYNQVIGD